MHTVPLGNTGVLVSPLCLGTMHFSTRDDEGSSFKVLDSYIDNGGSFLDTANSYSFWIPGCKGGESEALLGKWMKHRGNRSQLFVATKVGFPYSGTQFGLSPKAVQSECHSSLRRLGIDTIDLYYAHVDDRSTDMQDTMQAFDDLVRAGKVRFLGASNFLTWRLEQARWVSKLGGFRHYCCVQQRHSYLRPKPGARFDPQVVANEELFDFCRSTRMSLLAYSPLLGGFYNRDDKCLPPQYVGPDTYGRLAVLREVAAELNATAGQIVLAWLCRENPPVIPVMGASTVSQLKENVASLNIDITPGHIERLSKALTGGTAW